MGAAVSSSDLAAPVVIYTLLWKLCNIGVGSVRSTSIISALTLLAKRRQKALAQRALRICLVVVASCNHEIGKEAGVGGAHRVGGRGRRGRRWPADCVAEVTCWCADGQSGLV